MINLIINWTVKLRLLWFILIASLLLSGCVRYDLGVNFFDANHGNITQKIHLSSQITGVSRATAHIWLDKLAEQAEQLGGEATQPTKRDLVLKIPFYNTNDFINKFDRFFQTLTQLQTEKGAGDAPLSQIHITTNNFILWQRHHLTYDLDLRSLSIIPDANNTTTLLVNPEDLIALKFVLHTPWGAQSPTESFSTTRHQGQLTWTLKPGEINHLEAVFAIPNLIGIGLTVIVLLVLGAMFFKAWRHPSSLIDLPAEGL
jgi:hypothetical protein